MSKVEAGSQYRIWGKRLLDLSLAVPVLVLLLPFLGLIALLVRLKLGSPVLFRQLRPGLNGRPFQILKFRTMTDARDADGRLLPDAQRLTPLGRLLRLTSFDELPELFNVLKGEMSLVGPRPLLMEYLPCYSDRERLRHSIRPGITGLSQVSGRNFLSWDARLELDAQYAEQLCLSSDLAILLATVVQVINFKDIAVIPRAIGEPLSVSRKRNTNESVK